MSRPTSAAFRSPNERPARLKQYIDLRRVRPARKQRPYLRSFSLRSAGAIIRCFAPFALRRSFVDLRRQYRRRYLARQLGDHVLPLLHELRSALDQIIRPERISGSDISRNGHHFAVLFGREPRRYQRAASLRRLDYQYTQAQPAYDSIAIWKVVLHRRRAERELCDASRRRIEYLVYKPCVLLRIYLSIPVPRTAIVLPLPAIAPRVPPCRCRVPVRRLRRSRATPDLVLSISDAFSPYVEHCREPITATPG